MTALQHAEASNERQATSIAQREAANEAVIAGLQRVIATQDSKLALDAKALNELRKNAAQDQAIIGKMGTIRRVLLDVVMGLEAELALPKLPVEAARNAEDNKKAAQLLERVATGVRAKLVLNNILATRRVPAYP